MTTFKKLVLFVMGFASIIPALSAAYTLINSSTSTVAIYYYIDNLNMWAWGSTLNSGASTTVTGSSIMCFYDANGGSLAFGNIGHCSANTSSGQGCLDTSNQSGPVTITSANGNTINVSCSN